MELNLEPSEGRQQFEEALRPEAGCAEFVDKFLKGCGAVVCPVTPIRPTFHVTRSSPGPTGAAISVLLWPDSTLHKWRWRRRHRFATRLC